MRARAHFGSTLLGEDYYPFEFEGELCVHHLGRYRYTVVYLPEPLRTELPLKPNPRLRIEAEIGETGWSGAWQPGQGHHYLMVSPDVLRQIGKSVGDRVEVRFRVVPQDHVDVPVELQRGLALDDTAQAPWEQLSAGHQRGLCHWVAKSKKPETRSLRLGEVLAFLRGEGHDPSKPKFRQRAKTSK